MKFTVVMAFGGLYQVPIAQVVEIMKRKREIHEHVIAAAQQQRAAAKAFEKVCI